MIKLKDILCETCWDGYKQVGMKELHGKMVPNCVPVEEVYIRSESDVTDVPQDSSSEEELAEGEYCPACMMEVLRGEHPDQLGEADYHGHKVSLGKPMRGDVKKFKVFVKDPSTGNIKKVNFGDKTMRIKKYIPSHRKSFRARHHCDTNPGPKTKARYWSCRKW